MSRPDNITRRTFLKRTATCAMTCMGLHGCGQFKPVSTRDVPEDRPNIILVMGDNVGFTEFGINGNDTIKTPHLDAFAREGVRFDRFYCNPMCAPTRASLMTGRYYYRTGVIHTSRGGAKMHGDETTLAEHLKTAGYATGIFGKWHLGDNYPMRPQDQGFDSVLVHKSGRLGQVPDKPNSYFDPVLWSNGERVKRQGYCTDIFFQEAKKFIEDHRSRRFFVYLPTNVAHTSGEVGLQVHRKYSEPYKAMGLDDKTATVYGMITNLDENVGRLLDKLDALDLRRNTLIIFLTDDGNVRIDVAGFRGRGQPSVYEGGLRVPCFVQWPAHLENKGLKIDAIASHIDILPTLMDVCGLNLPAEHVIDGVSLMTLLEGRNSRQPERMLFFQCHRGLTPKRYQNCAVVTQRFKMVGYPDTFNERKLETSGDNPVLELYDLATDPGENNNVATRYPDELAKLRTAYDAWFDDVKSTRQFTPGYIHLGSDAENPTYLCRYQDGAYIDQQPTGWPVNVERSGQYEFTINRGPVAEKGRIYVSIDDKIMSKPLEQGQSQATFTLPAGRAKLNVWVQEQGKPYVPRSQEDTIGDVVVRRLEN
ncbi:MAG: arylsulfatase [Sedimentisphaerales bacterium]|nr:arylsulfatase [Sedimentisphaerales bacterium]